MSNSPVTLFCFSHVELLSPHVKTFNSHLKLQLSQVKRQILRLWHFLKGQSYTDVCEKNTLATASSMATEIQSSLLDEDEKAWD